MESRDLVYYDWEDIQKEICKEMNISLEYFRDYHKIVGGEYKDLWHAWINYFDGDLINGKISNITCDNTIESMKEWVLEDSKEWLYPFIDAVYAVWEKFHIEHVDYSW